MASNSLGLRGSYKRKYFSWNWKLYNVLFRVYLHLHSTIPHNRKKQFLWQMLIRQFSKAFTGFHSFLALWMTCVGEPGSFNKVTYVNIFFIHVKEAVGRILRFCKNILPQYNSNTFSTKILTLVHCGSIQFSCSFSLSRKRSFTRSWMAIGFFRTFPDTS